MHPSNRLDLAASTCKCLQGIFAIVETKSTSFFAKSHCTQIKNKHNWSVTQATLFFVFQVKRTLRPILFEADFALSAHRRSQIHTHPHTNAHIHTPTLLQTHTHTYSMSRSKVAPFQTESTTARCSTSLKVNQPRLEKLRMAEIECGKCRRASLRKRDKQVVPPTPTGES